MLAMSPAANTFGSVTRLQGVAHLNETVRIQREAGFAQPRRAAGARDPDDLVGVHGFAARRLQARRRYRD